MRLLSVYLMVVGFLSLNPWLRPDTRRAVGVITWDLVDHVAAYGILTILFLHTVRWRLKKPTMTLILVLASSVTGVLFEFCQHWFTSTRQFSLLDGAANVLGAVAGAIIFWSIRSMVRRVRQV